MWLFISIASETHATNILNNDVNSDIRCDTTQRMHWHIERLAFFQSIKNKNVVCTHNIAGNDLYSRCVSIHGLLTKQTKLVANTF